MQIGNVSGSVCRRSRAGEGKRASSLGVLLVFPVSGGILLGWNIPVSSAGGVWAGKVSGLSREILRVQRYLPGMLGKTVGPIQIIKKKKKQWFSLSRRRFWSVGQLSSHSASRGEGFPLLLTPTPRPGSPAPGPRHVFLLCSPAEDAEL